MLLLLPPSETKLDGGADGTRLDLGGLSFAALDPQRRATLAALTALSADAEASARALGLGPTQADEVERNRRVASSPVLPAIERYTGVLYDGIRIGEVDSRGRAWARDHLAIHSALFGLVGAGDPIPAYRCSHDSRLPGLRMGPHWRAAIGPVLADEAARRPVVDLRSSSYAALGPGPEAVVVLRVVTDAAAGRRVAISHDNKRVKGALVGALVRDAPALDSVDALVGWARDAGFRLERSDDRRLDLVV